MSYRGDRFNRRMLSTNLTELKIDPAKNKHLGDAGLGVERLLDALDFDDQRERKAWSGETGQLHASAVGAVLRLVFAGKPHLVKPLLLIFENENDLESSLKKMKKSSYFWARNQLLEFFIGL